MFYHKLHHINDVVDLLYELTFISIGWCNIPSLGITKLIIRKSLLTTIIQTPRYYFFMPIRKRNQKLFRNPILRSFWSRTPDHSMKKKTAIIGSYQLWPFETWPESDRKNQHLGLQMIVLKPRKVFPQGTAFHTSRREGLARIGGRCPTTIGHIKDTILLYFVLWFVFHIFVFLLESPLGSL